MCVNLDLLFNLYKSIYKADEIKLYHKQDCSYTFFVLFIDILFEGRSFAALKSLKLLVFPNIAFLKFQKSRSHAWYNEQGYVHTKQPEQ